MVNKLNNKAFQDVIQPFHDRLVDDSADDLIIRYFEHYYRQLLSGETGMIHESEISAVDTLSHFERLSSKDEKIGKEHMSRTVMVKLNGGLGTSMGLTTAKSLLPVRGDLTFLDIIARQTHSYGVKLLLMNSERTHEDSLRVLESFPEIKDNLPLDFLQHRIPKVKVDDLSPAQYPKNPDLEWCPPGHGDIYIALVTSGILDQLLNAGFEYAFVSNADNLAAVPDSRILGFVINNQFEFLMEVAQRTIADQKGGHLAKKGDHYILREIAQCPKEDRSAFQDIKRHKYFNTNNLWIYLPALKQLLQTQNYLLELPLIRNVKYIDPTDPTSFKVYQMETAMGSAISVFDNAGALCVPRQRFAPVKNTNDLLLVRSDYYRLSENYQLVPDHDCQSSNVKIDLDKEFYSMVVDFEERFKKGVPSCRKLEQLTVKGDFSWGANVTLQGTIVLNNHSRNRKTIQDGVVIGNVREQE